MTRKELAEVTGISTRAVRSYYEDGYIRPPYGEVDVLTIKIHELGQEIAGYVRASGGLNRSRTQELIRTVMAGDEDKLQSWVTYRLTELSRASRFQSERLRALVEILRHGNPPGIKGLERCAALLEGWKQMMLMFPEDPNPLDPPTRKH